MPHYTAGTCGGVPLSVVGLLRISLRSRVSLSASFAFPPAHRLRTPAEYKQVYDLRHSVGDDRLLLFSRWNGLPHSRLGTSVSKKVGNSVVRHRWKRILREAFRLQPDLPAGLDFVIVPRQGVEPVLKEVQSSLLRLAERAIRKWPRPPAEGPV